MLAALATVGAAGWAGVELDVHARGEVLAVSIGAVVFAAVAGAGAAQLLRWAALRTSHSRRTYWSLAAAGLLVSSVPPLVAATDAATAGWLLLAHAVVAAVLLPTFAPGTRQHTRS